MKYLIACVLIIVAVVRAEYPVDFPKCKNGDGPCLAKAANEVLPKYFSGFRDINLSPYDPLHIKSLVLDRNPSSPVNVDLKFTDLDLIGLKNMKVKSFTGLNADLSGRTVFEAFVPELHMNGIYKMDGRILLLPIVGEGNCDFTLKNVQIKYSFDLKPVEKNGQTYATLEHVKLDLDVESVKFQLDDLFNGDKALSDNMNKILNESSKEVFEEIKPSLSKGLGLISKQLIIACFEKYPYAEYFL